MIEEEEVEVEEDKIEVEVATTISFFKILIENSESFNF